LVAGTRSFSVDATLMMQGMCGNCMVYSSLSYWVVTCKQEVAADPVNWVVIKRDLDPTILG